MDALAPYSKLDGRASRDEHRSINAPPNLCLMLDRILHFHSSIVGDEGIRIPLQPQLYSSHKT